MMLFVRSLLFHLSMWITLATYIPIAVMLILPLSRNGRYQVLSLWPKYHTWLLKVLCRLDYQVQGREHLPKTAAIILAKHQSTWETFAFNAIFPPQTWVLKRELMWVPFFGWGMALLHPIAIDRGAGRQAMEQLVQQGREQLKSGLWVIIFPEGTRIPANKRGRYRLGGAVLAKETGYPIVPVAHNAGSFWPRRGFLIRPGVIKVVIGPMIQNTSHSAEDLRVETENWIETQMQVLEGRTGPAELVIR